jgi:hypothetical protein
MFMMHAQLNYHLKGSLKKVVAEISSQHPPLMSFKEYLGVQKSHYRNENLGRSKL